MKKNRPIPVVVALSVLLALVALFLACGGEKKEAVKYHCPMHPTVVSDKKGSCPICGMDLVPIEKPAVEKKASKYFCPMHPEVVSDKPGTCPICKMDLVPMKKQENPPPSPKRTMYRSTMNPGEVSDKPGKDSMGMEMVPFETSGPSEDSMPGHAAVSITPERARLLNMKLGTVETRRLVREIRTSAVIVPSEKRLFRVNTKIEGWVEKLFVNVSGQFVRKGQPMFSIYSPELVATQQEFLSAVSIAEGLSKSPYPSVADSGSDLVEAAKRRLLLWDISEKQIERLRTTRQAEKTMTIYSPVSGYVMEKNIIEGQKVMAGEPLLTVADLSSVWAEADIYEPDVPYVQAGMDARVALSSLPGRSFAGKVVFLNPYLDPMTRTAKARIEIANPALDLKPQMYADAYLSRDIGEKLAVPGSAVMRTGEKNYVFVAAADNAIQPVEVTLGPRSGDYFEVISGLKQGDRVVTSANFLIDSESSLKSALEAVSGGK